MSSRSSTLNRSFGVRLLMGLAALLIGGCGGGSSSGSADGSTMRLPEGFPSLRIPSDNPYSAQKAALGRRLFYDKRLSLNGTQACAGCHLQSRAFTDARTTAIGSTGEAHPRNSPSLANVGYNVTLNWANPLIRELEDQLLLPLFGENPVELGFSGKEDTLLSRLKEDAVYREMFKAAFPGEDISLPNISKAIATFQRTLLSGNSPYDQYVYQGKQEALSESAKRGLELFFSERLECDHCHGGVNFSSATTHSGQTFALQPQFENNGLYNIDGNGGYPLNNRGLIDVTGNPADMGKFKPPSLRNVEVTAPYMHDGSIASLEDVLAHYARGGRKISSGPYKGDGSQNPYKSGLIAGFSLNNQELEDLLTFLRSLTDTDFLTRCDLSDPFESSSACVN